MAYLNLLYQSCDDKSCHEAAKVEVVFGTRAVRYGIFCEKHGQRKVNMLNKLEADDREQGIGDAGAPNPDRT